MQIANLYCILISLQAISYRFVMLKEFGVVCYEILSKLLCQYYAYIIHVF